MALAGDAVDRRGRAREWIRQDDAERVVRRFVAIDGPNQGILNCSPNPANYFQLPTAGGFVPSSEVCVELGSPRTEFLRRLNHDRRDRVDTLVIRNADLSFVYFPVVDGVIAPVPASIAKAVWPVPPVML